METVKVEINKCSNCPHIKRIRNDNKSSISYCSINGIYVYPLKISKKCPLKENVNE